MELVQDKEIKLSKKLMPKKFTGRKYYKLVNIGETDHTRVNEITGLPVTKVNPYYITEGIDTIFDKYEEDEYNKMKVIKNVVGRQTVNRNGSMVIEDQVGDVEFVNGICVVKENEIGKYIFLERSNGNKANPFRDKSKPAIWEPVQDEKDISDLLAEADLMDDAIALSKEMSMKEAAACAKALGIPNIESKNSDQLRWDLRLKAQQNPKEFIRNSKNGRLIRKIQIGEAKIFKIIGFDEDSRNWIWMSEKDPAKKVIANVPVGKASPEEVLDNFLVENVKVYQRIVDALKSPEDFL